MRKPQAEGRVQGLKAVYDGQFKYAAEEDRVKASFQVIPGGYGAI